MPYMTRDLFSSHLCLPLKHIVFFTKKLILNNNDFLLIYFLASVIGKYIFLITFKIQQHC